MSGTDTAAPTRRRRAQTVPTARAWADVAVLLGLTSLGIIGFAPSFGGAAFLVAGVGGMLIAAATAVTSTLWRLTALPTAAIALFAYLLAGPAFAVPALAFLGFLPTLQGLANVAIGSVYGWADIVTLGTPVGAPVYIGVVPYAASWIVTLVAVLLAVRWLPFRPRTSWRLALVALGPVALYLAAILLGTDEAFQAGVRGVVFAVILLVWLGWRAPAGGVAAGSTAALRSRKLAGTTVLVVVAVVAGGAAGALLAPDAEQRFVLRDEITPPFDPLDYPSPLAGFRYFSKQVTDDVLLEVDGIRPGDRLRMAVLDSYSGTLWNVAGADTSVDGSGSFALVGRSLPAPPLATTEPREPITVTVVGYDDVWVPGVGYPDDFQLLGETAERSDDLRYNAGTGSLVLTSGLAAGDAYQLDPAVQIAPALEDLDGVPVATVELPPVESVPDIVAATAQDLAADAVDPITQLESIRGALVRDGFFSRGRASDSVPSRAGHGADRMIELLERPQMVGDEEQYASAFALMARSLGYPARVVMGFAPDVPEGAESVAVTGDDVSAWVEVAFDGVGWVAFEPTPDETDIPQDQEPAPQSQPQPQVRQPPTADNPEDELLSPVELDELEDDEREVPFVVPGWVVTLALSILIPLALVLLPLLIVAGLKARRARRRRHQAEGHHRVAGAWEEVVDRYAELGFAVPERVTRPRAASHLVEQAADLPTAADAARLTGLATIADDAVFSGRLVAFDESDEVWRSALDIVSRTEEGLPRSRRILSRYRIRRAARAASSARRTPRRRSR
ncbi:transglutaminase superfamily protein [Microcella putealis]|uniref:Transglutaminase superfamily protein n=1 Tax=Microcella putealis TaxID=337005 RepID=A0A4V2EXH2_9MICO|nr:transglutaminase-like domain-containing protein [Microcella putealis]RZS59480.1 transglutaminase superfamily protein [Microcella putealis]TQM20105.1 transglutaminase superfamily protein [Microcella putealis]TQM26593.1 transglutaminase superfamily protein [Microcella putealis]